MKAKGWFSYIGPGLLYAGAAIGVSHLVQSTRAGALFGFQLIAFVLVVNLLKYPFFEAGSRYAGATGKSLVHAYGKINKNLLWIYVAQTFITMFIVQMALTIVTTGIVKTLFKIDLPDWNIAAFISLAAVLILTLGHYNLLKKFTTWVVITLSICTVIAVAFAFAKPVDIVQNNTVFALNNKIHIAFLVALIGWMPAPLDISVWQSVWRVDGKEEVHLGKSMIDFHVGFWGTAIISITFMSLGALIFFKSGQDLATGGSDFSAQLVNMYTSAIGKWAWPIVAFAAFGTMFTTCLTCLDANPRVILRSLQELKLPVKRPFYIFLVILSASGAVLIPVLSRQSMTTLVDFATTVSFMTAPFFATLNYMVNRRLAKEHQPGKFNVVISWLGLIFLYGFAIFYVWGKIA